MKTHEDIIAWQKGYQLAKDIYRLTTQFPEHEKFGLISQMRRASVSIPSNIAEGYHRQSRQDYRRFCYIAYGSTAELQTQVRLAKDIGLAPRESFRDVEYTLDQTKRLLCGLCKSLR